MGLYYESVSVMGILDFRFGHRVWLLILSFPASPAPSSPHSLPLILPTAQKILSSGSNLVADWLQLPNPNFLLPGEHFDG